MKFFRVFFTDLPLNFHLSGHINILPSRIHKIVHSIRKCTVHLIIIFTLFMIYSIDSKKCVGNFMTDNKTQFTVYLKEDDRY